ncbi:hypothetical protein ONQ62_28055, partial [Salmonella enterica subsp. enterica serovar Virginia]|nr:hypothetical protein [Salmonella enterica subsp. enterica serovar Virginia]
YAAMNQVLRRRYGKAIEESKIPDVILIDGGKGQLAQAKAVFAAQATERRIVADIDDSELKAPRDGRVQYRVAEPGEVLSAGGRV